MKPKLFIMKKIFLLILIIVSVATIHSCKKKYIPAGPGITPISSEVDVYVAGFQNGKPCYWKNGQAVTPTDENAGMPSSIAVMGSDVYVASTASRVASDPFDKSIAKYWKNGQIIALTDGSQRAAANSIVVVGSDVYVAGSEESHSNGIGISIVKYWKNGQAIALSDVRGYAKARSIFVAGNDVYVAGL